MDWSNQLDSIIKTPKTVDEAVNRIMVVLGDEHKQAIYEMQEGDLISLHFSLGIEIRNVFGLHDQSSPLLKSLGYSVHPDDVSMVIINALWKKLNQE